MFVLISFFAAVSDLNVTIDDWSILLKEQSSFLGSGPFAPYFCHVSYLAWYDLEAISICWVVQPIFIFWLEDACVLKLLTVSLTVSLTILLTVSEIVVCLLILIPIFKII